MAKYKLTNGDNIIRDDGASIPNDPANRDYAEYLVWKETNTPDPADPIPPPVQSVLSQDLMAQFTADDAAKIKAAIDNTPQFWLLWNALTTQKDPMDVPNARFQAGWSALVSVLGAPRMTEIAAALKITP